MIDVNTALTICLRTGKVIFGGNNARKTAKLGRAKLIIISTNCPQDLRDDIEYYCNLSNIPIFIYNGTSIDLGVACRKPFMVSAMTIRDPGDSEILKLMEDTNV